ncbi:MAG: polysaccharide deacetylase family protein [Micromonosporaceae bacterium]|nr:polysaccharide deacetylase family protein [Micromonosporaceae bacterium]
MICNASVVNLTVHRITRSARERDAGTDPTWVEVEQFTRVLDAVAGREDVALTFDDGYASDAELALPLLRERGLRAQFFVLAGLIGHPGRLDEAGIRQLLAAGMSIGSHGWAHRDWRKLDDQQAAQEFTEASQVLATVTGRPVTTVAIPFGSYDRHVLRSLRQAKVTRAYTSDGGLAGREWWLQPRTSLCRDLDGDWIARVLDGTVPPHRRLRLRAARTVKRLRGRPEWTT